MPILSSFGLDLPLSSCQSHVMNAGRAPFERELVLVTGKGGVGKTVVAAALAKLLHARGRRVLITEIAPDLHTPSVLLRYFEHQDLKNDEPVQLEPGLFGVRISASIGHRLFLRAALRVRFLVDAAMKSSALTRFLLAAPTFPEIGILYQLVTLIRSKQFDHIVVDLPATGHAIGLTSLPRTVLKVLPGGLIGDAIREGVECMTNPERTGAIVVSLPEAMPVVESADLIAALERSEIKTAAAFLNRIPQNPLSVDEQRRLRAWAQSSSERLMGTTELRRIERAEEARRMFRELMPETMPIAEIPLFDVSNPLEVIDRLVKRLNEVL